MFVAYARFLVFTFEYIEPKNLVEFAFMANLQPCLTVFSGVQVEPACRSTPKVAFVGDLKNYKSQQVHGKTNEQVNQRAL